MEIFNREVASLGTFDGKNKMSTYCSYQSVKELARSAHAHPSGQVRGIVGEIFVRDHFSIPAVFRAGPVMPGRRGRMDPLHRPPRCARLSLKTNFVGTSKRPCPAGPGLPREAQAVAGKDCSYEKELINIHHYMNTPPNTCPWSR
jgi:hypothetical protein